MPDDVQTIRSLAARYAELAADPIQEERRLLWRRHNSLKGDGIPIYVRRMAFQEMPESRCLCRDEFYRGHEWRLRKEIYRAGLGDDYVLEPWWTMRAVHERTADGLWGLPFSRDYHPDGTHAFTWDPPIKDEEDIERIVPPRHRIHEAATRRRRDGLQEAMGDVLPVLVDRGPACGRINVLLGNLRGMEQLMLDMVERPDWLHRLMSVLRDGVLGAHEEAEAAGDWKLLNHHNQSIPYAEDLADPAPGRTVKRSELWGYFEAQELTGVSPRMFDEFMVQYQMPIMREFALTAYGCCEDLTDKIDVLRPIPNLRRIAVTPAADAPNCAEQIADEYVVSYRPNPADMVGYGWDPDRVGRILRRDLGACRANGCHVDVCLKDTETVQGDPERVPLWVQTVRDVAEKL